MTLEEQNQIVRILDDYCGNAVGIGKRASQWAAEQFSVDGKAPDVISRGVCVDYRVVGADMWTNLTYISLTSSNSETNSDRQSRRNNVKNLFFWANKDTSNMLGDVIAIRYMPYVYVNNKHHHKEDETKIIKCTDTGERRQWNQLDFRIYDDPRGGGVRNYDIIKPDIHKGDDLCWYQSWLFSLEDDVPCPVAPIIVEEIDDYKLVLRYKDRLHTLSMEVGQPNSVTLEEGVPVHPTHNWGPGWLRDDYTFDLVLDLSWKEKLYSSTDKEDYQEKPHFVRTSDLPADVRTMQQIDHDAWEEAVRSGAI